MINYFVELYSALRINNSFASYLAIGTMLFLIFAVSFLINWGLKHSIIRLIKHFSQKSANGWVRLINQHPILEKLSHVGSAIFIYWAAGLLLLEDAPATIALVDALQTFALIYLAIAFLAVILTLLDAIYTRLKNVDSLRNKPLKGYLQFIKIFLWAITLIVATALLLHRSPWEFLAGIGALSAVLMFVFKDTILGLLANIQVSVYDMVRVGDLITIEKYNVTGFVTDISVGTVTIRGLDNSFFTLPTIELVNNSIQNARGILDAGARRITRSLRIDVSSIQFCSKKLLDRLQQLELAAPFIEKIRVENAQTPMRKTAIVMASESFGLTNVTLFRAYIDALLKSHDQINQKMMILVSEQPPTEMGLTLQILAFFNGTDYIAYENTQSDILDHLIAVAPFFELRLFQVASDT